MCDLLLWQHGWSESSVEGGRGRGRERRGREGEGHDQSQLSLPAAQCREEVRGGGHSKSDLKSWDKNSLMSPSSLTCKQERYDGWRTEAGHDILDSVGTAHSGYRGGRQGKPRFFLHGSSLFTRAAAWGRLHWGRHGGQSERWLTMGTKLLGVSVLAVIFQCSLPKELCTGEHQCAAGFRARATQSHCSRSNHVRNRGVPLNSAPLVLAF